MNRAVFYILSGKDYIDLARISAMSLAKHMPYIPRFLFTPDKDVEGGEAFHRVYPLPERESERWYLDCTLYLATALNVLYAQRIIELVYLDSDTFVVEPFYELFDLLYCFDLVAAHAPGRQTCPTVENLPDSFPELNIGVMGLRNTYATMRFAIDWHKQYYLHQDVYGNNDQGSLRETLWAYSNQDERFFSFYVLPPEYNCRPLGTGCFLNGKARILHMRHPNLPEIAEKVNEYTKMRIWKP